MFHIETDAFNGKIAAVMIQESRNIKENIR